MAKYIVEVKDGETLYKAVIAPDGEPYITPAMGNVYTEPDLEQVKKEAYEKGWKEAEDHYEKGYNDGYDTGLEDAWKVADKIFDMPCLRREQIFSKCDSVGVWDILRKYSASEAIEKIRQYEQKQEEIIDPDKNKVEALANDIGIHKLYALVKEIRGE